jgi:hypothetical protein
MWLSSLVLASSLAGLFASVGSQGESPVPAAPSKAARPVRVEDSAIERNHFTFSITPIGLGVEYARQRGRRYLAGAECGVGSDCLFSEAIVSNHEFAQPLFGGDTGREWPEEHGFGEVAHLGLFCRYVSQGRWRADCGLWGSGWMSEAADRQSPVFLGAYVAPTVRWHRIRCGPRVMVGEFWMDWGYYNNPTERRHSPAIVIVPLTISIDFATSW